MKITVLSHAGMLVEHNGVSLVIDPWLIGSCYWRSWWNFPEPDGKLIDDLQPNFVYITHLHWDHYQGPSLRRFPKQTKFIFPRFPTTRMVDDLHSIGFTHVTELRHSGKLELGPDFAIQSYHFNPIAGDSALVIKAGNVTILNVNDSKVFGRALREILREHPRIDFVFRSHSSASAVPYCIDGFEELVANWKTPQDYAQEFVDFCVSTRARYAVPFASNHCFLHRDTEKYNAMAANPEMVKSAYDTAIKASGLESECVIMPPGSSWEEGVGFALRIFDYVNASRYIEEMKLKYQAKLERQYTIEERSTPNWKLFQTYFDAMMGKLPWVYSILWPIKLGFEVSSNSGAEYWVVDFRKRRVARQSGQEGLSVVVKTHHFVLNQCCAKKLFSSWAASKRLMIYLKSGNMNHISALLNILDMFENDVLSWRDLITYRAMSCWLSRWREWVSIGWYVIGTKAGLLSRNPWAREAGRVISDFREHAV